jgi:hypothetical protein
LDLGHVQAILLRRREVVVVDEFLAHGHRYPIIAAYLMNLDMIGNIGNAGDAPNPAGLTAASASGLRVHACLTRG